MDSGQQLFVALCMLSFACNSWAGKIDFPFSDMTSIYSFKARTGKRSSSLALACGPNAAIVGLPGSQFLAPKRTSMFAGEEVHSVSEPLPAYLLPQEPYFSVVKSILRPTLGKCPPDVSFCRWCCTQMYRSDMHTRCSMPRTSMLWA